MGAISVIGVSKAYKGVQLFHDATFDVEEGAITALVGPNGSGKSVLLRILCGFTKPDAGEVIIDPQYFTDGNIFPTDFGVMIDRPGYISHLTGLQNLMSLAAIRRVVTEPDVRSWMQRLGLDPDSKTKAGKYSLGMKQKLALCQAVMEKQRVWILDEPFNALDDSSQEVFRDVMREHVRHGGTIVFTSHNAYDVASLASVVLKIDAQSISIAK